MGLNLCTFPKKMLLSKTDFEELEFAHFLGFAQFLFLTTFAIEATVAKLLHLHGCFAYPPKALELAANLRN